MYELVSYWIIVWGFLFYFGLNKHNPIIILITIYLIVVIGFIYIYINNYKNKNRSYYLLKFIIINVLPKFILIVMILSSYEFRINFDDINFGLLLFLLYFILMISLNKNPIEYYYYLIDFFINGKTETNSKYLLAIDYFYDDVYNYYLN